MKSVDVQAKQARAIGGTIAALEGLKRAAADAGLKEGQVVDASDKLNRALGQAITQGGQAGRALDRLGLDAEKLSQMDADERMATLADAMRGLPTAEVANNLRDLGIRGKEMNLLMQGGGDAIRAATKEMKAYGVAMSEVDAAQVEAANDAWDRVKLGMQGVANTLAVKVSPYIQALAEYFTEASKESEGFGDTMDLVMEGVVTAIGWVLDAMEYFKRGWRELQLLGHKTAKVQIDAMAMVARGVRDVAQVEIDAINAVIRGMNRVSLIKLPEIRFEDGGAVSKLQTMAFAIDSLVEMEQAAVEKMANEPLPSKTLKAWVDEVKRRAREAAAAVVEARKKQQDEGVGQTGESPEAKAAREGAAKEAEDRKKRAAAALADLQASLRTRVEAENAAYEQRMQTIQNALDQQLITQGRYNELAEKLEKDHQQKLSEIQARAEEGRLQTQVQNALTASQALIGAMEKVTGATSSESKKQFEIHKAFAISSALVAGAQAVVQALAVQPFPVGAALAVGAAATSAAQVSAIASQTFGGGGSVRSPSGGSAAAAGAAAGNAGGAGGPAGGTLTVQGLRPDSLFSGAAVEGLVQELLDYQRQGGRVVLA